MKTQGMKTTWLAGAALAALTGAPCAAQSGAGGLSPADRLFVTRAADGNLAEVTTSQMALKKGRSPQVKQVAQMLIQQHGQAQAELKQLAARKGVTLPPTLGPTHRIVGAALEGESGRGFDATYLGAQVEDHENTVALFQQEIASGQDPAVKAYAAKYLPKIEGHTAMIYRAAQGVGVTAMRFRPAQPPAPSASGAMGSMGTAPAGSAASVPAP
jgi:putative membrane protein